MPGHVGRAAASGPRIRRGPCGRLVVPLLGGEKPRRAGRLSAWHDSQRRSPRAGFFRVVCRTDGRQRDFRHGDGPRSAHPDTPDGIPALCRRNQARGPYRAEASGSRAGRPRRLPGAARLDRPDESVGGDDDPQRTSAEDGFVHGLLAVVAGGGRGAESGGPGNPGRTAFVSGGHAAGATAEPPRPGAGRASPGAGNPRFDGGQLPRG